MGGSEKEAPLLASTAAGESGDKGDDETGRSEVILLLKLAGPLLVANIAEEVSLLFMYVFWANLGSCKGHSTAGADCVAEFQKHGMGADAEDCPPGCHYNDGTMQLAAANDMYSGSQMAIVFIFGAQQAVYTMAPQAYGAGNHRQVGIILQMCLFWSLVVLGLPTALAWASMGEAMDFAGLLSDDCGGSNATNATQANATHAALTPSHAVGANSSALNIPVHHRRLAAEGGDDEQLVDVIGSYGVASCWYLGPYVLMYTLMTWLESIEVVAWAEPLKGPRGASYGA
jgi:Na+-driven multidrug efflux pump